MPKIEKKKDHKLDKNPAPHKLISCKNSLSHCFPNKESDLGAQILISTPVKRYLSMCCFICCLAFHDTYLTHAKPLRSHTWPVNHPDAFRFTP